MLSVVLFSFLKIYVGLTTRTYLYNQWRRQHGFDGFGRTHQFFERGSRTHQFFGWKIKNLENSKDFCG